MVGTLRRTKLLNRDHLLLVGLHLIEAFWVLRFVSNSKGLRRVYSLKFGFSTALHGAPLTTSWPFTVDSIFYANFFKHRKIRWFRASGKACMAEKRIQFRVQHHHTSCQLWQGRKQ
ncbi:hypothetical protein AAZX31_02G114500 [Glycine max]